VEGELQRRLATNEAKFREVNEALERGRWPGEEGVPVAFRCECASLGCTRMIELTPRDYERIRAHSRRFLIAPGHDVLEAETIVETHEEYLVVEKRKEAGRVAEATDPRP
jgi:hypothetical protein